MAGSATKKYAVDIDDVRAAATRIAGHAHRTPVTTCASLDGLAGRHLFFKCEQLQRAGAFKFRGASPWPNIGWLRFCMHICVWCIHR